MKKLVCALTLALGCTADDRPDVLLITLDTTRADRIGTYGDDGAKTPVLDALGEAGVVFERAFASVPVTLPSHTTILTGLEPHQHGVHDNGRFVAPAELSTVAERLGERGYATGAFVSAFVLDASFGLDQGFDVYDDEVEPGRDPLAPVVPTRRGAVVTDRALAWLHERGSEPVFAWAHYYDVHSPRRPPEPYDALDDPYAGELAYVDAQVGRLVEGVRAARERQLLVIVVGDHGESLGQHDEQTHGALVYDSTLRVPLIAVGPGFPAGERSQILARTADVAPSILASVGESLDSGDGAPLQSLWDRPEAERVGYFETMLPYYGVGWARLGGVRTPRWKLTAEPAPVELYDVIADPDETRDLAESEPGTVEALAELYAARKPSPPRDPRGLAPSAEVEQQLAALGYLAVPQRYEEGEEPDPRRFVRTYELVQRSAGLAREGHVARGIRALEALAESPIARGLALARLAPLYRIAGRPADAERAYGELAASTGSLDARIGLAYALLDQDRAEEALASLEPVAGDAGSRGVRHARARALLALDRRDEVGREIASLLADDPGDDGALMLAARWRSARDGIPDTIAWLRGRIEAAEHPERLVMARGALAALLAADARPAEAEAVLAGSSAPEHLEKLAALAAGRGEAEQAATLYARALEARPHMLGVRRDLADLQVSLGRHGEAVEQYERLIAAEPGDAELRLDHGVALAQAGRPEEAVDALRDVLRLDPELPEAHLNLGLLARLRGDDAAATGHLMRAIELRPDYAKAHLHLATLYRESGDPRASFHAAEAVAAADPLLGSPE